ncbi:MAG: hypothetical protein DMF49_01815, partial [Acidobacteria bacterium]
MTHLLDQAGPGDGAAQVQAIAASPGAYCNRVLPGARLRESKSQGGPDHRTGKQPEGEWKGGLPPTGSGRIRNGRVTAPSRLSSIGRGPMKIRLAVVSVLGPLLAWPAAAQAPGDVGPTVRVASDRQTITWGAVSGADSYNVYRGQSPALADQTCLVVHTTSLAAADSAAPASGGLFYYLVSAVNSSGEGTLGNRSDGTPRPNTAPCQDADADLVPDNRDNCPGVANPSQADQNSDGLGDACDGKTYDFEADALGARPAAMTQTGGVEPSFLVRDYSGDKGVAYDGGNAGVQDVFVRFGADEPFEPTNIYMDFDGAAETSSLELWSDGAYGANAGEGVIFQIGSGGQ